MEEGSQWKRGEDNFITLHVGKMAGLLFSRPTGPWVRRPPAAAASQVLFFPSPADARGCWERCGVSLSAALRALLFSTLPSFSRLSRREDKSAQPGSVQLLL